MTHKRKLDVIYNSNNNNEYEGREYINNQSQQPQHDDNNNSDNYLNNENLEYYNQQLKYHSELDNQQLELVNQFEADLLFIEELYTFYEKTNYEDEEEDDDDRYRKWEIDEIILKYYKKNEEAIINSNLLNYFLKNPNATSGLLSFIYHCQTTIHKADVSKFNIIVQVGLVDSQYKTFSALYLDGDPRYLLHKFYDSKYHYNLTLTNFKNTLYSYSVIQILKLSKTLDSIYIKKFKVLSNRFSNLIYKNTIVHPSEWYFKIIDKNLNIFPKVDELVTGLNTLKQHEQLFTTSNSNIDLMDNSSLSLITSKYNIKMMAVYLLSHLNHMVEIGTGFNAFDIYVTVLSKFGCLNTINSIHSFYSKSCNKNILPIFVKHLNGLFDRSIYLIKNNLLIQNEIEWKSNLINQYTYDQQQEQKSTLFNQQLIMVYNQDVFEFGNSVKPELYCNKEQFSIDNNRNVREYQYCLIDYVREYNREYNFYENVYPHLNEQPPSNGNYSINPSLSLFKKCFSVFTNGIFDNDFDWGNENDSTRVIVSGSSVLACLEYLPYEIKLEYCKLQLIKRLLYKSRLPKVLVPIIMKLVENNSKFEQLLFDKFHGHQSKYMESDIDLWIITDNIESGKQKLKQVANQLLSNLKMKPNFTDYLFIRSNQAISLISTYPFRKIQIIVKFYRLESEVISHFDFDCVKSIYNGENVYLIPKTINSLNTRSNLMSDQSPPFIQPFESRYRKYVNRGFRHIFRKNILDYDYYEDFNSGTTFKKETELSSTGLKYCSFKYNYSNYQTHFPIMKIYSNNNSNILLAVVKDVDHLISNDIETIKKSKMYWGLENFPAFIYGHSDFIDHSEVDDFSIFNSQ